MRAALIADATSPVYDESIQAGNSPVFAAASNRPSAAKQRELYSTGGEDRRRRRMGEIANALASELFTPEEI